LVMIASLSFLSQYFYCLYNLHSFPLFPLYLDFVFSLENLPFFFISYFQVWNHLGFLHFTNFEYFHSFEIYILDKHREAIGMHLQLKKRAIDPIKLDLRIVFLES